MECVADLETFCRRQFLGRSRSLGSSRRQTTAVMLLSKLWSANGCSNLRSWAAAPRTIDWYAQKMRSYLGGSNATKLSDLTAFELKRFLGELRDRGLAPNTIHGFFETLKALVSWAQREHYSVDAALLRMRAP